MSHRVTPTIFPLTKWIGGSGNEDALDYLNAHARNTPKHVNKKVRRRQGDCFIIYFMLQSFLVLVLPQDLFKKLVEKTTVSLKMDQYFIYNKAVPGKLNLAT